MSSNKVLRDPGTEREPGEAVNCPAAEGFGLQLRPWDEDLIRQMGEWGERGFPYNAFDMGYLQDPARAAATFAWTREPSPHLHFMAVEDGKAVGRVSVNMKDEAGLYIWAVHVPPEHEGRAVCRRMLAALMTQLETEFPGDSEFVLTTNTFAEHAHRAYYPLGFRVVETRWHFDSAIAEQLWKVSPERRESISRHIRFHAGRWEVRTHVMKRRRHEPMETGLKRGA